MNVHISCRCHEIKKLGGLKTYPFCRHNLADGEGKKLFYIINKIKLLATLRETEKPKYIVQILFVAMTQLIFSVVVGRTLSLLLPFPSLLIATK